jgi:serine/threonine protein kinase
MEVKIGPRWVLRRRLGAGSFGEVYSGEEITSKEEIAVKIESVQSCPAQLPNESRIYRMLAGGVGIPTLHWFGEESDYHILVMDLLGASLQTLFEECGNQFSLKTVLMIADQLLGRIEWIHEKNVVHRDIKPGNFVIGRRLNANLIYVVDMGISRQYRNVKTGKHIGFHEGKSLLGTALFTSINTHLGFEQSRRDDLEGIAYVLIYFMKGTLPWMASKAETRKQRYEAIGAKKLTTQIRDLCDGLPEEFAWFLTEVRKLQFTDRPDYQLYRQVFRALFVKEGFVFDYMYDWVKAKPRPPPLPTMFSGSLVSEERKGLPTPRPLLQISKRDNPSAPIRPNPGAPKVTVAGVIDRPLVRQIHKPGAPPARVNAGAKPVPRVIRAKREPK